MGARRCILFAAPAPASHYLRAFTPQLFRMHAGALAFSLLADGVKFSRPADPVNISVCHIIFMCSSTEVFSGSMAAASEI